MTSHDDILLGGVGESNLELYLKEIYDNKIAKDIERCDVEFIQAGVQHVIKSLSNEIFPKLETEIKDEIETFKRHFPKLKHIANPAASTSNDSVQIVQAGSFYEESVLGNPEDFLFIIVIGVFQSESDIRSCHTYPRLGVKTIAKSMRNLVHDIASKQHDAGSTTKQKRYKQRYQYNDSDGNQHIYIHRVDMDLTDVCDLSLVYTKRENNSKTLKNIKVTIATAFRVNLGEQSEIFCPSTIFNGVSVKMIPHELMKPEYVLISRGKLSMVEIEHYFMKNLLTSKHKKVYSLLKHLLRMNDSFKADGWLDDRKRESRVYHVTMFELRRVLFYHNNLCENDVNSGYGACILDILSDIYDGDFLPENDLTHMRKRKRNRLRKLLGVLKSEEESNDEYIFEEVSRHVTAVERSANVVKAAGRLYHEHNESFQVIDCVISAGKYVILVLIGAVILYFILHAISTPR